MKDHWKEIFNDDAPSLFSSEETPQFLCDPAAATSPDSGTLLLSEVLQSRALEERRHVVESLPGAVHAQKVRALPIASPKCKVEAYRGKRKGSLSFEDEVIENTDEFKAWLEEVCKEARLLHRAATGNYRISLEEANSGGDFFQNVLDIRLHVMKAAQDKGAPTTKPKKRRIKNQSEL